MGTSTHAENTYRIGRSHPMGRNYLRVRGEYTSNTSRSAGQEELPPRTRRILFKRQLPKDWMGTTSAYAENTRPRHHIYPDCGNYLRVRGEYTSNTSRSAGQEELPPRTRRILFKRQLPKDWMGTTSAYAENTSCLLYSGCLAQNYLRVRGEYVLLACTRLWGASTGLFRSFCSPLPRARGRTCQ